MPTITESQLRFIIREELISILHESNLIEEGFMSDTLTKYSKYGRGAALGAALGVGGLEFAKPFNTANTEIAYTASHKAGKMQDMGYTLTQNGDLVTISKDNKSITIDSKIIEQELRNYNFEKDIRNAVENNTKIPFLDEVELYMIDSNMPESKKLVKFLENDPVFKAELRKSYLYGFGQVGLFFFGLICFFSETIGKVLASIERRPQPYVRIPKIADKKKKI
ncbi:MAG: hypothetical protein EBS86_16950 [Crocinitomicaceae bacterium]|jgi:hypothetical protein|nr:hypothetical protein [Crocinitomicaceae bacterium]